MKNLLGTHKKENVLEGNSGKVMFVEEISSIFYIHDKVNKVNGEINGSILIKK